MKLQFQVVINYVLCIVTISGMRVSLPPVGKRASVLNSTPEFLTTFEKPQHPEISRNSVAENWITQKLNHCNKTETRTWQMRYLTRSKYFVDGGPIFIFLGGAQKVSSHWIEYGLFHDIAMENHGYLVTPEHRYFGESIPTPDLSTSNLRYLNIRQTLADVAHLIRTLKADDPKLKNAKVIMAGYSYSGSLVVWFKRLYPELVDGSWASSAPLEAKANFYEKSKVIGEAFQLLGSQQCYDRIKYGFRDLDRMIVHGLSDDIITLFNICNDFNGNNELDKWTFFTTATLAFSAIVIHGNQRTIPEVCSYIMEASDDLTAVVNIFQWYYKSSTCVDHASFVGTIKEMSNITDLSRNLRQLAYLSCNEVGWYQTSDSWNQPFSRNSPISLFVASCAELFGNQYTKSYIEQNVLDTNELFRGRNTTNMQNVYMTYGEFDQWRPLGAVRATIIPRASVTSDLASIRDDDSTVVKVTKRKIARTIRNWLNENPSKS